VGDPTRDLDSRYFGATIAACNIMKEGIDLSEILSWGPLVPKLEVVLKCHFLIVILVGFLNPTDAF